MQEWVKDKGKFQRGYAYAEKELAKSKGSAAPRLRGEADNAFDFDDFDRGIVSALRAHNTNPTS